jgi:hypothetical protein
MALLRSKKWHGQSVARSRSEARSTDHPATGRRKECAQVVIEFTCVSRKEAIKSGQALEPNAATIHADRRPRAAMNEVLKTLLPRGNHTSVSIERSFLQSAEQSISQRLLPRPRLEVAGSSIKRE